MFTEDLDAFFSTHDFALDATLQDGSTVQVIFDQEHLAAFDRVSTTNPVCMAKASAIAASNVGDTLEINGTTYKIRDRQPLDDAAVVQLQLEKQ